MYNDKTIVFFFLFFFKLDKIFSCHVILGCIELKRKLTSTPPYPLYFNAKHQDDLNQVIPNIFNEDARQ